MKPFGVLIAERAKNPERCIREALTLLERFKDLSGNKTINLEQASWFAAIVFLGCQESQKQQVNVTTITAEDSIGVKDNAS
jgi:hypothetical protein